MVSKQALLDVLNDIAPLSLSLDFDNCGLLIDANDTFNKVLLCVDVTHEVLNEAIKENCDFIISHHPIIFDAIKKLDSKSVVFMAVQNNISVYAAHTNMDFAKDALNDTLCEMLGVTDTTPLAKVLQTPLKKIAVYAPKADEQAIKHALHEVGAAKIGAYDSCFFASQGMGSFTPTPGTNPALGKVGKPTHVEEVKIECICKPELLDAALTAVKKVHSYEQPAIDVFDLSNPVNNISFSAVGKLKAPITLSAFVKQAKKALDTHALRVCGDLDRVISTVAVSCGYGGDMVASTISAGADVLFTGEVKHNYYLDAVNGGIAVVEAGHYATEKHFVKLMQRRLQEELDALKYNLAVKATKVEKQPYTTI